MASDPLFKWTDQPALQVHLLGSPIWPQRRFDSLEETSYFLKSLQNSTKIYHPFKKVLEVSELEFY